jgi:murein DD-endopeptidase MepM/ murein hydrolase activator NlpD
MFKSPLRRMKLRTKGLNSSYGASFGRVRKSADGKGDYAVFHQGWDLEAESGTPCYAVAGGVITHVGNHPAFGLNIVLQFSRRGQNAVSPVDALWAFYAHLSGSVVSVGTIVAADEIIGFTGHSGNAGASSPHLHFEIRNTANPSPGLGEVGRLDPAIILGYSYLQCS